MHFYYTARVCVHRTVAREHVTNSTRTRKNVARALLPLRIYIYMYTLFARLSILQKATPAAFYLAIYLSFFPSLTLSRLTSCSSPPPSFPSTSSQEPRERVHRSTTANLSTIYTPLNAVVLGLARFRENGKAPFRFRSGDGEKIIGYENLFIST